MIVIADDDADIRETLRYLFEGEGQEVVETYDGSVTLDYLHQHPEPCVVLLDLAMPQINGLGVLRAVAAQPERHRDHRFLLITALHTKLADADLALLDHLGITLIMKPFEIEDLLDQTEKLAASIV